MRTEAATTPHQLTGIDWRPGGRENEREREREREEEGGGVQKK